MARMRPVIHSTKHYVQMTRSTALTVAINTEDLALSVESTTANLVDEIAEGTLVKAIYVELWLLDSSNDGSFVVTLAKYPGGVANMGFAQSLSLGTWINKKNILYVTQGLSPNDGGDAPVPIIRQWFKIPKTKQRFGLGDALKLSITNQGANNLFYCGFATYKEYS